MLNKSFDNNTQLQKGQLSLIEKQYLGSVRAFISRTGPFKHDTMKDFILDYCKRGKMKTALVQDIRRGNITESFYMKIARTIVRKRKEELQKQEHAVLNG